MCFTLKGDDTLDIKVENPIETLIQTFRDKVRKRLKGKELEDIQAGSKEAYLRQLPGIISAVFKHEKIQTNIVFMNERHILSLVYELITKETMVGIERSRGVFDRLASSPKQLQWKKDGSLLLDYSSHVQQYWVSKGFKP